MPEISRGPKTVLAIQKLTTCLAAIEDLIHRTTTVRECDIQRMASSAAPLRLLLGRKHATLFAKVPVLAGLTPGDASRHIERSVPDVSRFEIEGLCLAMAIKGIGSFLANEWLAGPREERIPVDEDILSAAAVLYMVTGRSLSILRASILTRWSAIGCAPGKAIETREVTSPRELEAIQDPAIISRLVTLDGSLRLATTVGNMRLLTSPSSVSRVPDSYTVSSTEMRLLGDSVGIRAMPMSEQTREMRIATVDREVVPTVYEELIAMTLRYLGNSDPADKATLKIAFSLAKFFNANLGPYKDILNSSPS